MNRVLAVLVCLSVVSPLLGQENKPVVGSGKVVSETRKLAEFDEIELRICGDVRVTIGKPTPLVIEGEDNILPLIKTEVQARRLTIWTDKPIKKTANLELKVTLADLKAAEVRGSGDMRIHGLDNESLSLVVRGSGNLQVTGKTKQLSAAVSGSGDIKAFDLTARRVSVTVRGSGDAQVNAAESLNIVVSGSGDVVYKGNAKVHQVIHGSGDVKRRK